MTAAKFFAAERSIDGPPMSICSMTSSGFTPGFRAVSRNGYRLTQTTSIVVMPCAAMAARCSGRSRRASKPPCTAGCNVFTRPSSISGKFVTSLMSRQASPAARSVFAVPPVETSSKPSSVRPRAKSTSPDLSETESSARGIEQSDGRRKASDGRRMADETIWRQARGGDSPSASLVMATLMGSEESRW